MSSRCMNPRKSLLPALAAAAVSLLPSPVAAHAIDGGFPLPVPLWLYLAGAAAAVAASFVVVAIANRRPRPGTRRGAPIHPAIGAVARLILRVVGLVWWYGAIGVGIFVGDISPLPAVALWVGIWIALPIVSAVFGNPWPSMSPFRTTFAALEWLAERGGMRLDAGLRYPARLARWPAVLLLGAAIWAELILPEGGRAATVAGLMIGYTLLTLVGMSAFGTVAWLRNVELFEVLLGWYGRIGPIGRRSVAAELCAECSEGCDAGNCVDCPECVAGARDSERRAELRPWLRGLTKVRGAAWSDAAFVVLLLVGVTYDGLRETPVAVLLLSAVLTPINAAFGLTLATFLLVDTAILLLLYAAFLAAFTLVAIVTRTLQDDRSALATTAGAYAATLLPIAAGYLVAHYLTLVIQSAVWLPSLLADPLMSLSPEIGWIPIGVIWYLSVASIVGGHVAGVALAHRLALLHAPRRALLVGVPMVLLMVGYTVMSLWIIAQPIVVEPGVGPLQAGIGS